MMEDIGKNDRTFFKVQLYLVEQKTKFSFFSQKKLFDRQKDQRKRSNRQGEEIKLTRERHKTLLRETRERDQTDRQEKEIRQTDKRKRSDRQTRERDQTDRQEKEIRQIRERDKTDRRTKEILIRQEDERRREK